MSIWIAVAIVAYLAMGAFTLYAALIADPQLSASRTFLSLFAWPIVFVIGFVATLADRARAKGAK